MWTGVEIFANEEIVIGRDQNRWSDSPLSGITWLISYSSHAVGDRHVSNKHLRIYNIVFEEDSDDEVLPLVYAEDVSRHGTFLNGSLIPRGFGGVLLADGDELRLSPSLRYRFRQLAKNSTKPPFDDTQKREMEV